MARALITGITGQDGSWLAESLLDRGYEVHGVTRSVAESNTDNIRGLLGQIRLHEVDPGFGDAFASVLDSVRPTEVYNLAAQSSVRESWQCPGTTAELTALNVTSVLEAIRRVDPSIRMFQASSSEVFGYDCDSPLNEASPLRPETPYGAAKAYAHFMVDCYRKHHGLFACSGILFSHESERRGLQFVTRKITDGVARVRAGLATELTLGNLESRRDWGFAGDFAHAMWLMLQDERPADYVVGTGQTHSVRDFVELAFAHAGLDWREHVRTSVESARVSEPRARVADATRARARLGWQPLLSFNDLVRRMVDADLRRYGVRSPAEALYATLALSTGKSCTAPAISAAPESCRLAARPCEMSGDRPGR